MQQPAMGLFKLVVTVAAIATATAAAAAAAASDTLVLPWTPAAIVLVVTISKDIGIRLPHPKYPDFKLPPNILNK